MAGEHRLRASLGIGLVLVLMSAAAADTRVTVRLIAVTEPGDQDEVTTLPAGESQIPLGQPFALELWATTVEPGGLATVYVDVDFGATPVSDVSIEHTELFDVLVSGVLDGTSIEDLGGGHLGATGCADEVGVAPKWARVAIVHLTIDDVGPAAIGWSDSGSAFRGISICGEFGNVDPGDIDFGSGPVELDVVECLTDEQCDDGFYCNGTETCIASVCVSGEFPCGPGEGCDEVSDTCGPCANDGQCNDFRFCNGRETCDVDTGVCVPGEFACEPGEGCDELSDTCGPCVDDEQCFDFLFCNGVEACDAGTGVCGAGDAPCDDPCERCDEETDTCLWCIVDLDQDGFIGSGDFGFFSSCFGACYDAEDLCSIANFDGDPNQCVGSGDFAAFSSCFGLPCSECGVCAGPPAGGDGPVRTTLDPVVALRLVALESPSPAEAVDELPVTQAHFDSGDSVYVELWASVLGPVGADPAALASVYVSFLQDPAALPLDAITVSSQFSTFARGELHSSGGMAAPVGGCATPGDIAVGVSTAWVRVATFTARAEGTGTTTAAVLPADEPFGVSLLGQFGNLDPWQVEPGGVTISISGVSERGPARLDVRGVYRESADVQAQEVDSAGEPLERLPTGVVR